MKSAAPVRTLRRTAGIAVRLLYRMERFLWRLHRIPLPAELARRQQRVLKWFEDHQAKPQ